MASIPIPPELDRKQAVKIDYTNYKGERKIRTVIPIKLHWGGEGSKWHKGAQWLLDVYDLEKGAFRTYALFGIHGITS